MAHFALCRLHLAIFRAACLQVYADTKCEVRVEGVTASGPTFPGFEAAGIVDGKTDQDHGWRSRDFSIGLLETGAGPRRM